MQYPWMIDYGRAYLAASLAQHPDEHGPKRPVLLAVDQQAATPRYAVALISYTSSVGCPARSWERITASLLGASDKQKMMPESGGRPMLA